jgi:DNA-binding XRE family transcriptional regulator
MKLKQYRTKHHLSVIQLAKILDLSRQHIYDMEREKVYPSRQLALDIETKLKGEVTARELLNI